MIVVTGGAGFIGQTLIEKLKTITDEQILCVDYNINKSVKNMHPYFFMHKMLDYNFTKSITTIFHNGACSDTTNHDINYMMTNNYDYSTSLLKKCLNHNIKFIYASSASVYGLSCLGAFKETDERHPANIYAKTKSLFDDYASVFMNNSTQIVGLRYFNVYGQNESHKGDMASVVYRFFKQKKEGKINLFEKSRFYKRDFIHVEDIVNINIFFWKNTKISGIFNAGTGIDRSFQEIADIICKKYNTKINYISIPQKLRDQYQTYTKADTTLLRNHYKESFMSIEEGVNKYLTYLEANET